MDLRVSQAGQAESKTVPPALLAPEANESAPRTLIDEFVSILRSAEGRMRLSKGSSSDELIQVAHDVVVLPPKEKLSTPRVQHDVERSRTVEDEGSKRGLKERVQHDVESSSRREAPEKSVEEKSRETTTEKRTSPEENEEPENVPSPTRVEPVGEPELVDAKEGVKEASVLLESDTEEVSEADVEEVVGAAEDPVPTPFESSDSTRVAAQLARPEPKSVPVESASVDAKAEAATPRRVQENFEESQLGKSLADSPKEKFSAEELLIREGAEHLQALYAQAATGATSQASFAGPSRPEAGQSVQEAVLALLKLRLDDGAKGLSLRPQTTLQPIGSSNGVTATGFGAGVAEKQAATPRTARTMPPALRARTFEKVEEALKEVARSRDGKSVSLRLDPPSLGSVRVDVSIRDGNLHARVRADTPQVMAMLREHGHELQASLRRLGLDVGEVTVAVRSSENDDSPNFSSFKHEDGRRHNEANGGQELSQALGDAETPAILEAVQGLLDHWVA